MRASWLCRVVESGAKTRGVGHWSKRRCRAVSATLLRHARVGHCELYIPRGIVVGAASPSALAAWLTLIPELRPTPG